MLDSESEIPKKSMVNNKSQHHTHNIQNVSKLFRKQRCVHKINSSNVNSIIYVIFMDFKYSTFDIK